MKTKKIEIDVPADPMALFNGFTRAEALVHEYTSPDMRAMWRALAVELRVAAGQSRNVAEAAQGTDR